jgi:adenosylhomocysteinase
MDMSFALQALCARYLSEHGRDMKPGAYAVPPEIDRRVAGLKLRSWGRKVDVLTDAQAVYLAGWEV